MRILVIDYAGHPFQYELSEELARRGHDVIHSYCSSVLTPQAAFERGSVKIAPVDLGHMFNKYSIWARTVDELRYGMKSALLVWRERPDVVLSSNVPVLSLTFVWAACSVLRVRWVLWLQDLQSGLAAVVRGTTDVLARLLGVIERFLIRRARAVVVISREFEQEVLKLGAERERVKLVENWAPLSKLPVSAKSNSWSIEMDIAQRFVFLYSGTLGRKHAPHLLLELAREFVEDESVVIVVVAEGPGADALAPHLPRNVKLLPFQPFDRLPDVLGSADVLVALLDSTAGRFSVPSKALTYLCAERPILASVPSDNAAARLINRSSAGIVVDGSAQDLRSAGRRLRSDGQLRARLAAGGRRYAETHFRSSKIAERFESVLSC